MNKIGIHYAYWARDWNADFFPLLPLAKSLDFDILEVNSAAIVEMAPARRKALKAAARDSGIELAFCTALSRQYDLASPDSSTRRRGVDYLKRQANAIGSMGGKLLGGIIYGSRCDRLPPGVVDKRPYLERSIRSMSEAVRAAEDNDVVFMLEVVNRFEQFLLNTAQEAVGYVKRVGSPHCRILLDTFHINIEEESFEAAVRTAGPLLGHVHLGEANRRPPGRGRLPWSEFFATLNEVGYRGALTVESFVVPGGEVGRDLAIHRDLSSGKDLNEEASRALQFVRGCLSEGSSHPANVHTTPDILG